MNLEAIGSPLVETEHQYKREKIEVGIIQFGLYSLAVVGCLIAEILL